MKKIALICICTLLYLSIYSQNLTFYGFLPAINQTGRLNKKINYNLFLSSTIDAFKEKTNGVVYPATDLQFYLQPSLIYLFSTKVNFAASYTYQRNNPLNKNFINEHRFWQQVIFTLPVSAGRLTNRFRFEQRFIENKSTSSFNFSTRARYQIGFIKPLQGRTIDEHEFYFNTYNEFYISITGTKNATYSENWTYAGCGYNLGKMGRVETGYLFQTAVRNKNKDLRFLQLIQMMWITNFNISSNKKNKIILKEH